MLTGKVYKMKTINKEVVEFTADELAVLAKLGIRERKGAIKVEKSAEEKALISKALSTGKYVTKGGGDGSKPRLNKGVGRYVRKLISEGIENKDILEMVCKAFGNDNTTMACVAWYRNDTSKNWTLEAGVYVRKV